MTGRFQVFPKVFLPLDRTTIRAPGLTILAIIVPMVFASGAEAQNLEAGKSPAQIFAGTCTACHRGSRGLVKTISPGSLPGFLREHYTTSNTMADALSAYLLAGGDGRPAGPTRQTAAGDGTPQPDTPPEGRKQRQAAVTPDGQPEGPKDARKPRGAADANETPPADQLPKGPKARAKALALAKAEAAKEAAKAAAEAKRQADAPKADAPKTDVAAIPPAVSAPKQPLADIGAKPAENPAESSNVKPKEAAVPVPEKPAQNAKIEPNTKTEPADAPKVDSAKAEVAAPPAPSKSPDETKPGAPASASEPAKSEQASLGTNPATVKPEMTPPPAPRASADIASAKTSVSAAEGAAAPKPAINSMAPPPSPPISY